ncbi:MAG: KdsC family phosphatase [Planctomycetota bacterium]|jgi:3-deoxy-D-manno-octulosonate 8-phosphate phosphatase (KDO 8-P phosphatase)
MSLINKRLCQVELLILDVDGVMTDGRISYTDDGKEIKSFNAQDGAGIKYWKRAGNEIAIITGRKSEIVTRRAEELGIEYIFQDAKNKAPCFEEIIEKTGITPEKSCYVGDDLPDIPVMRLAGVSFTVANGVTEAKDFADFTTKNAGGDGAVREVIELILKAQQKWDKILARYFPYLDNN